MQVSPYSATPLSTKSTTTLLAPVGQQGQYRAGANLEVVRQVGGKSVAVSINPHEFMQLFNTVVLKRWLGTGTTPTAATLNTFVQLRNLLPALTKQHPQQSDALTLRLDLTTASQQGGDAVLTLLKRSATQQYQTVLAKITKATLQDVTRTPFVTINAILTKMTDVHKKMQQANSTFLVTARQQVAAAQQSVQPLWLLCQQVVQRTHGLLFS
jgi:hypothetical protein